MASETDIVRKAFEYQSSFWRTRLRQEQRKNETAFNNALNILNRGIILYKDSFAYSKEMPSSSHLMEIMMTIYGESSPVSPFDFHKFISAPVVDAEQDWLLAHKLQARFQESIGKLKRSIDWAITGLRFLEDLDIKTKKEALLHLDCLSDLQPHFSEITQIYPYSAKVLRMFEAELFAEGKRIVPFQTGQKVFYDHKGRIYTFSHIDKRGYAAVIEDEGGNMDGDVLFFEIEDLALLNK